MRIARSRGGKHAKTQRRQILAWVTAVGTVIGALAGVPVAAKTMFHDDEPDKIVVVGEPVYTADDAKLMVRAAQSYRLQLRTAAYEADRLAYGVNRLGSSAYEGSRLNATAELNAAVQKLTTSMRALRTVSPPSAS